MHESHDAVTVGAKGSLISFGNLVLESSDRTHAAPSIRAISRMRASMPPRGM